jgi:hypothetical protein
MTPNQNLVSRPRTELSGSSSDASERRGTRLFNSLFPSVTPRTRSLRSTPTPELRTRFSPLLAAFRPGGVRCVNTLRTTDGSQTSNYLLLPWILGSADRSFPIGCTSKAANFWKSATCSQVFPRKITSTRTAFRTFSHIFAHNFPCSVSSKCFRHRSKTQDSRLKPVPLFPLVPLCSTYFYGGGGAVQMIWDDVEVIPTLRWPEIMNDENGWARRTEMRNDRVESAEWGAGDGKGQKGKRRSSFAEAIEDRDGRWRGNYEL